MGPSQKYLPSPKFSPIKPFLKGFPKYRDSEVALAGSFVIPKKKTTLLTPGRDVVAHEQ